jgi:hypothetical protein
VEAWLSGRGASLRTMRFQAASANLLTACNEALCVA